MLGENVYPDMLKTKNKLKTMKSLPEVWTGPMIYSRMFLRTVPTNTEVFLCGL